jgi:death-on-curing protein
VTIADALAAHDDALKRGGRPGIVSLDQIESALGRPYSGYHRPIWRKAAALLHSLVGNHGFTDANKRTAWMLVEMMLDRSGFRLDVPDDEPIDDLVVAVAAGEMEFDALVEWFRARIVPE